MCCLPVFIITFRQMRIVCQIVLYFLFFGPKHFCFSMRLENEIEKKLTEEFAIYICCRWIKIASDRFIFARIIFMKISSLFFVVVKLLTMDRFSEKLFAFGGSAIFVQHSQYSVYTENTFDIR